MVFALQVTRVPNVVGGTLAAGAPSVPGSTQTASLRYLHHDHLGSVAAITDGTTGTVIERLAFDPWGKRRNTNGQADTTDSLTGLTTDRGYTEHEQLDEMGLIHMNGRVYDPLVGRMMSADPIVQAPTNLKTFNRYAYVWNNPLKLYDPDGFNAQDTTTGSFVGTTTPSSPPSSSSPRPTPPANCTGSCNAAPIPTGPPDSGPKAPAAEPLPTGFWGWVANKLGWFDNNVANPLLGVALPLGVVAKVPKAAATAVETLATAAKEVVAVDRLAIEGRAAARTTAEISDALGWTKSGSNQSAARLSSEVQAKESLSVSDVQKIANDGFTKAQFEKLATKLESSAVDATRQFNDLIQNRIEHVKKVISNWPN